MAIKRIAREEWGIKQHGRKIIYNMVAVPIAAYASSAWFERINNSLIRRHLAATQRTLLLMITRAARTTSTVAMQVIAGVQPLDLTVIERAIKYKVKRNQTMKWANYTFTEIEAGGYINIKDEYHKIEAEVRSVWQQRWIDETHGRHTFCFVPRVDFSFENEWFKPSREAMYLLTGYGLINSTLFKRGAEKENKCPICKVFEETVVHMIFECLGYQGVRYQEIEQINDIRQEVINTKERFKKFNRFAREIFAIRRTYL